MVQKIDEEVVKNLFGSTEMLDKEIATYKDALVRFTTTEGEPAPTTSPVVEIIVKRHGGAYEVVAMPPQPEPEDVSKGYVPIQPPPEPKKDLEQLRVEKKDLLADTRYNRVMDGIVYKGHPFAGDPLTINSFMAALLASDGMSNYLARWKDAAGNYIELERSDMLVIIKAIRTMTQACYDNEFRIIALLDGAQTILALSRINLTGGWPE